MKLDQNKLREILIKENFIGKDEAGKADEFVKNKEGSFLDYFIRQNRLTPDLLGQALAEYFSVSYLDLNTNVPSKDLILKIPEEAAKRFRAILFKETEDAVSITTDDPLTPGIEEEIRNIFPNKKVLISFSLSEDIDSALLAYKKTFDAVFSKIIRENQKVAPEIIDQIIEDALDFKVSDVHFDPQENEVILRFRIDGFLHEVGRIPIKYYDTILNRIKIQAGVSTIEHFSAQDGAIRYERNGSMVDLRVSVVPTLNGSKIVIRILAEHREGFALDDLGFSLDQQKLILKTAKKPFGMILVTGPTGSGKTTTLYALLKYLNGPGMNIATIEDPVEYMIPGVNHIQVNPATNLTFVKGLKSIVRQDPDIILVGEIRDKETAGIAVDAALAGHLLFSTFHANNAASVIPRLLEMGVEPFNLSLTLKLVISQRLVRKLCTNCRYSYKTSVKELSELFSDAGKYFKQEEVTLYKSKGCLNCSGIGYKGRTAIFEVINIGTEMEELMLKRPSAQQIWDAEEKQGIKSLFADGLEKVKNGETTIEELLRIAEPPEEEKKALGSVGGDEEIVVPKKKTKNT